MAQDDYAREKLNKLIHRVDVLEKESGIVHKPKERLNIGEAIQELKAGKRVGRWQRDDIYLSLFNGSYPIGDYIEVKTIHGTFVPWMPNHLELLAEDWRVIEDVE